MKYYKLTDIKEGDVHDYFFAADGSKEYAGVYVNEYIFKNGMKNYAIGSELFFLKRKGVFSIKKEEFDSAMLRAKEYINSILE